MRMSSLRLVLYSSIVPAILLLSISNDQLPQDFKGWLAAIEAMGQGQNPYQATRFLNWPPFWMMALRVLSALSTATSLPLMGLFQASMFFTGLLVVLAVRELSLAITNSRSVSERVALWGMGANPVWWLIVLFSGNFDVIVSLWQVLAVAALVTYVRQGRTADWLCAAMWIGLGIFTKTISFVLIPFLLIGVRSVAPRHVAVALWLVLAPAALSLGTVMAIDSASINEKVINYHSVSGWFGMTGWLSLLVSPSFAARTYPGIFFLLLLSVSMVLARVMPLLGSQLVEPEAGGLEARRASSSKEIGELLVYGAAFMFLLLPALGSGFGTHYLLWSWPLLAVAVGLGSRVGRLFFLLFLVVAGLTIVGMYFCNPAFGPLQLRFGAASFVAAWPGGSSGQAFETHASTPLFIVLLALLAWLGIMTTRGVQRLLARH